MLGLPSSVRIYLATMPVDMRKGVDGLSALVRRWGWDPFSGHLYVFLSKRRDIAKILAWDRGGFILWSKRLEAGRFALPKVSEVGTTLQVDSVQLAMLLDGVDFSQVRRGRRWVPRKAA